MEKFDSKAVAAAKYNRAIKLIEQAENFLSAACGELCPLDGALNHWQNVGDQYDVVRALSRKLAYSRPFDLDLDSDEKRRAQARFEAAKQKAAQAADTFK